MHKEGTDGAQTNSTDSTKTRDKEASDSEESQQEGIIPGSLEESGTIVLETQGAAISNAFDMLAELDISEGNNDELKRLEKAQREGDKLINLIHK